MSDSWRRYCDWSIRLEQLGMSLDVSRMGFDERLIDELRPRMAEAFEAMAKLEKGDLANPDEGRMVGHYWLRRPELAPNADLRGQIEHGIREVRRIANEVHAGTLRPPGAARFRHVLVIGIGGSALGPQFVSDALGAGANDKMDVRFLDNTDPDGIARVLDSLAAELGQTLCLVISKSGGTPETRNGMLVTEAAYRAAGLAFGPHAIAITGEGSKLDQYALANGWLARLPMFDWVGGRTSEFSAVGLLPAALQGIDVEGMLAGAAACDEATRTRDIRQNPAALMALMWWHATGGRGQKDLVVLPYKDRLVLLSRYLQQLIMESLGKERDLAGRKVEQGIAVYGNKGSTDQHAYVQQLREGVNNFFVTFIQVLEPGGAAIEVEPGITSADYLHGFLLGTRDALSENGRESMLLTIDRLHPYSVGALIALFERAVGFYASLVGINAYHQPGVEAGKKAAARVLELQRRVLDVLRASQQAMTATDVASAVSADAEAVWLILRHLQATGRVTQAGVAPQLATFTAKG